MLNNQSCSIAISSSSSSSKINHLDKDAFHTLLLTTHTMLPMKKSYGRGRVGKAEGRGRGRSYARVEIWKTIKNMMGIQTGGRGGGPSRGWGYRTGYERGQMVEGAELRGGVKEGGRSRGGGGY
ncbi:hypothetical protein CUMW_049700 [Citrus unshiu]|nr:hypothetical protein CUMW_049700 [Citrus unshiu]GAY40134.1 hypothetical protein CUMW_049700 [Citrus unshiu]